MRKKMFSKVLSFLLAAAMICTLTPIAAFADESKILVTVGVYDYTAVTYGCEKASADGTVLQLVEFETEKTATALDTICAAFDSAGITYDKNSQYGYLSEINGLAEHDCGEKSGWMFSVNNDFGNMGAAATSVKNGDVLRLDYSCEGYGTDVGSYFSGGPTVTDFSLCGCDVKLSAHTTYADENDYTGSTAYYIGEYTEGGENTAIVGDGSMGAPLEIPVLVPYDADITAAEAQIKTTLHEKYVSYAEDAELTDVSQAVDFSDSIIFALQTLGGIKKTYYKVTATKKSAPIDLTDYKSEWPLFRGNEQNMGITNAPSPRSASESSVLWQVRHSASWDEPITPPIIVDDTLYLAKKNKIIKVNKKNGKQLCESEELAGDTGFGLNPITYGGGMIFVGVGDGRIQALAADTLQSLWVSEAVGGQMLTAISYHNGYVYTGTWNSDTAQGTYFAVNTADEDADSNTETKSCVWKTQHAGGFYFAGAYVTDGFAVFGSDDGARDSSPATSVLYSVNPTSGEIIDTLDGINGDIRSTVAYDKETDRIYFLTKGGELYSVYISADGFFDRSATKTLSVGGSCTGTPLVHDGLAYFGVSGENMFSGSNQIMAIADVTTNPMKIIKTINLVGYAQGSALLTTAYEDSDKMTYVYTTYNNMPGGIQVISVRRNGTDDSGAANVEAQCSDLFVPAGDKQQFCLCSLACDSNGIIYYKNDSGYLFAISKKSVQSSEKTENTGGAVGGNSHEENGGAVSVQMPVNQPEKPAKKQFMDVSQNHWAREYIELLTENNITNGKSDELFAPDDNVTRAEFAALLHRMSGDGSVSYDGRFADVLQNDWFATDVSWAVTNGIAKGIGEKNFAPGENITRQDMAVMIKRYAQYVRFEMGTDGESMEFADQEEIADYARDCVSAMRSAGIISGNGNNTFEPTAFATRAQCAKMLSMLLK